MLRTISRVHREDLNSSYQKLQDFTRSGTPTTRTLDVYWIQRGHPQNAGIDTQFWSGWNLFSVIHTQGLNSSHFMNHYSIYCKGEKPHRFENGSSNNGHGSNHEAPHLAHDITGGLITLIEQGQARFQRQTPCFEDRWLPQSVNGQQPWQVGPPAGEPLYPLGHWGMVMYLVCYSVGTWHGMLW